MIAFVALSISFFAATCVSAQESAEDQKIEAARRKQAELKRQILEELEKQNRSLEEQLNELRKEKVGKSPVLSAESQVNSEAPSSPKRIEAAGNAEGGLPSPGVGNAAKLLTPLTAVTSTTPVGSQTDKKCFDPSNLSRADQAVCFLARNIIQRRIAGDTSSVIAPNKGDETFLLPALVGRIAQAGQSATIDAAVKSFVLDVEASNTDKQLGSDPKSSGTTSLGVKGGIPSVLSWAVENGAAVSSRDGTTVTFRFNPVGISEALSGQGFISGFRTHEDDSLAKFFKKTSVGFSFDTTRGTNPPTLIGSKQQLSAVSFRYQFVNQRDPRDKRYKQMWDEFFAKQGLDFTKQQTDQLIKLELATAEGGFKNATLQRWLDETNGALARTTIVATELNKLDAEEEVRKVIEQRLSELPVSELETDPALVQALSDFLVAYLPYLKEKKRIMDEVSKGTLVTFEYTNYREPNAPDLSNLRFIAEKGTIGGIDITANASLTFYNKEPAGPNIQKIRDFDFSAQLDKKTRDLMGLGPGTLSFTGKYQRLMSNAVAFDGTVLPNTKGDIAAGQIKFIIPIKDSGVKIPFSITFANRTELVREREVRGNFGFTLDLDTLFAKFKPFSAGPR